MKRMFLVGMNLLITFTSDYFAHFGQSYSTVPSMILTELPLSSIDSTASKLSFQRNDNTNITLSPHLNSLRDFKRRLLPQFELHCQQGAESTRSTGL